MDRGWGWPLSVSLPQTDCSLGACFLHILQAVGQISPTLVQSQINTSHGYQFLHCNHSNLFSLVTFSSHIGTAKIDNMYCGMHGEMRLGCYGCVRWLSLDFHLDKMNFLPYRVQSIVSFTVIPPCSIMCYIYI